MSSARSRLRAAGVAVAAVLVAAGSFGGVAGADAPTQVGWWSKLNPGLPIGVPAPFVPEGGLYVANDPAGPTAISALRYAAADGTPGTLTLQLAGDPVGTPAISACRVTSAWAPAVNGPMSQAPSYDCADAVRGVVTGNRTAMSWQLPGSFATMGSVEVALVPAPDAGPFQAPFAKPSATSFVPGAAPGQAPEGSVLPGESAAPASVESPLDATAPLELPASGGSFELPPPPPPSPPPPATAVSTPAANGGQVALPALPRVATPAGTSRADQVLGFSLLAALAAALWFLADRPVRAPRRIGGVRPAGVGLPARSPARVRSGRVGSPAQVRIGGIGRFARPRTTLPHRL